MVTSVLKITRFTTKEDKGDREGIPLFPVLARVTLALILTN